MIRMTYSTLEGRKHHMCRIKTVNEVWWECRGLFANVHYPSTSVIFRTIPDGPITFGRFIRVTQVNALQRGHNLKPL
jgi:hypothetical protein